MLNLIIDFNNILMRSLTTPGTTFYNSDFNSENDLADIVKKITIDICYNVRLFSPNRVIIVSDSPNAWRKDFLPNDEFGYKANRVKDETRNWDNLWKTVNEFKKILSENGFIVSAVDRAEADDLAALWKNKLFQEANDSIIFVSSDKDWRQLIEFKNDAFCMVFNPTVNNKGRKKLFIDNNISSYLAKNDARTNFDILFGINNTNSHKGNISNALKTDKKIDIVIVSPEQILIHKIFTGDSGDNVPAFYSYYKTTSKRGTYLSSISEKQTDKLCEALNIKNINDLLDCKKYIKEELDIILKTDMSIDVDERLTRQRVLVELNLDLFPINIVNSFNDKFDDLISINIKNPTTIKWIDVLNNTKFLDKNTQFKPQLNSVFSDLGSDFNKYFSKI